MKILFVTDKYFPKPFANAVCAQDMIEHFIKIGYEVHVLAFQDGYTEKISNWKGAIVHTIKPDYRLQLYYYADNFPNNSNSKLATKIASFLSKSKGFLLMPMQPFYSISFPIRIKKKLDALHQQFDFGAIVAMYHPFDGTLGATLFKRQNPKIPLAIYNVDTMEKPALKKYFGGIFADFFRWEKFFLGHCDAYFFMQSRSERYKQNRFLPWSEKLFEVDLPRFSIQDYQINCLQDDPYDRPAEHWVYAGSLNEHDYPVSDLIEFFLSLPGYPKRVLHFYGRGSQLEKIQLAEKSTAGRIIAHGYTEFEQLKARLFYADVLVSVKYSNQISAKTFEYLSYRKPIVHFSGHPEDPNVSYLTKYPKSYVVKTYLKTNWNDCADFLQWMGEQKNVQCDVDMLCQIYQKNTPAYSVEAIIKKLKI